MKLEDKYPYVLILYKDGKMIHKYHYSALYCIYEDIQGLKSEYTYKVLDTKLNMDLTKKISMA